MTTTQRPSLYSRMILAGLQPPASWSGRRNGKHVYAGTVPHAEVQRRRAANKAARASRRRNRRR